MLWRSTDEVAIEVAMKSDDEVSYVVRQDNGTGYMAWATSEIFRDLGNAKAFADSIATGAYATDVARISGKTELRVYLTYNLPQELESAIDEWESEL